MFFLLLLPAVATAVTIDSHIVGGVEVDIADYPWQGSYRTGTAAHTCGCVFVGGTWTLTAGHCGGSTAHTAGYGNSDRTAVAVYSIAEVTQHPNYGQGAGFTPNDYAVVRMNNAADSDATGIAIASNNDNPGGDGAITGWGRTCGSCALPIALHGVDPMPIIADADCSDRWGNNFNPDVHICVFSGSEGACNGDSGGPLSKDGILYGLTSWGATGCGVATPSAYARVGFVYEWFCDETSGQAAGC